MRDSIVIFFSLILFVGCITDNSTRIAMPEKGLHLAHAHPDNLNPQDYDKWFGKKPRIYLQGIWKIKMLDGTLEKPDDKTGENAGFAKSEFDDSKWDLQAVPGDWNSKRKKDFFGGIAWYRTKLKIPANYKGERILLHFGRINFESVIYVNGVNVGSHSNMMREVYSNDRRSGADDFTIDVTSNVKFGGENTVAVKVYMDKNSGPRGPGRGPSAGIVWPAWVEIAPPIYQRKVLIKPDLKNSSIMVCATIVNTFKEEREVELVAQASNWKSYRYQTPGPKSSTEAEVWCGVLQSGVNEINFTMELDDPVEWNLRKPYLYNLKLFANGDMIGQERFGFREFTASGSDFLLNGKKVYFTGSLAKNESLLATGPYTSDRGRSWQNYNRDGFLERMLKAHRSANLNILRPHSTHMQSVFYDLTDELGIMVNEEMWPAPLFEKEGYSWKFKNSKLAPRYVEYLKYRMDVIHNRPSVVIFSIGNELYDNLTYGCAAPEGRSWAPFINAVYDVLKAHYPELLISSSGRLPNKGFYQWNQNNKHVRCDYYDVHNYTGDMRYPWTYLPREMEYYFKEYSREGVKPVINGEFLLSCYNEWHGRRERKKMLDKNGELSKEKYFELLKNPALIKNPHKLGWYGHRVVLSKEANYLRDCVHYKEIIEVHRRNKQYCAGFEILQPALFKRYQKKMFEETPLFNTLKRVCNPTFVCLDLFDKNVFAGKKLEFDIYLFNELPETLEDVKVKIELKGKGLEYSEIIDGGSLVNGEKKIIPFKYDLPSSCPTGNCEVKLSMLFDGEKVSDNKYEFFVLGKDKTLESIHSDKKIALFMSTESKNAATAAETKRILDSLGIKYAKVADMNDLKDFNVLIVAQNSMSQIKALGAGAKMIEWVKKGGLILCFEQNKNSEIPFLPGMMNMSSKKTVLADVFETEHPVFKDLNHWNFRRWNGDHGVVASHHLLPLNMGLLAASCGAPHKDKWGMAIAEVGLGKGRVLFSDLLATRQYLKDSVATKYIQNLLSYCLGNNLLTEIHQLEIKKKEDKVELDLKVDDKKVFCADLRKIANMGFVDVKAGDQKGGWTDQGPDSDLRGFRSGIKKFLGVPFEIIDPENNHGKSCVVLRPAKGGPINRFAFLAKEARFEVNKTKVKRIFFLVASAWSKGVIGEFVINWENASSPTATVPLETGVNLRDWGSKLRPLAGGHPAWTSLTGRSVYLIEWKNPEISSVIRNIEFKSIGSSVSILLGVTVELE